MFNFLRLYFWQGCRLAVGVLLLQGLFLPILFFPVNSSAEIATLDEFQALGEQFDHLTTGFALTGEHTQLDCGDCHIGGVFEALPKECEFCHDNVIGIGLPPMHIETTAPCDTCHTTLGFIATATMDHSIISGPCASCHNGISATGKTPTHISSTNLCEACHTTNFWVPAINVDHDQVLGNCVLCHTPSGLAQTSKPPSHMPTSDSCEACHFSSGVAWIPLFTVDHGHVFGACSLCHTEGSFATTFKGPNHEVTTLECNACHAAGGTWVIAP